MRIRDAQIEQLAYKQQLQEQYSRRNCLRVFGVPESQNEKTDEVVAKVFKDKLNISLPNDAIDRSHRLVRPKSGKSRPIIVKFTRYNVRESVFLKKRLLKCTGMVVREDLTKYNLDVFNKAVEYFNYKNVWSRDSMIHVKTKEQVVKIKSISDVEKLNSSSVQHVIVTNLPSSIHIPRSYYLLSL